jgi:preprotein translocase subunit YajC
MMEKIINFFVNPAYADVAAGTAQTGGSTSFILMFVVFILFFYFAIWRPQNKRSKEMQTLLSSLAKGDEVITSGGLIGRIAKITDQYVALTIADNVEIVMQKTSVMTVLPKGTIKAIE